MISEWLYRLTEFIGNCFNNATGLRIRNEMSNILTGVTLLYIFLFLLIFGFICMSIICWKLCNELKEDLSE